MAKAELTPTEALAAAQVDLLAAQEAFDEAQRMVAEAQAVVDAAIIEAEGVAEPHQDQIARMNYIAAQQEARAARYGVIEKVFAGLQIEPADIDPRSPLDRAMRRNKARGTVRPLRSAEGAAAK